VVIDIDTDEYESVSFDTWASKDEAEKMVKYLKNVKMNSVIIMVIRDSSEPNNWNNEQISYVDKFGSETFKNNAKRGCPFIMFRRPWAMVTQKLPDIGGITQLPSWKECWYNQEERGYRVVIRKDVHLFKGCTLVDEGDFCYNINDDFTEFYGINKKVWKSRDNKNCNGGNDCHVNLSCNTRYSVDSHSLDHYCTRRGYWPIARCPECQSIFGIDFHTKHEDINYHDGENVTFNFEVNAARKPAKEFFYVVKLNNMVVSTINPSSGRNATEEDIEKIAHLSSSYNLYNHVANPLNIKVQESINSNQYSVTLEMTNLNASHNNMKFQFMVVDTLKDYALDYLHSYTKKLIYGS